MGILLILAQQILNNLESVVVKNYGKKHGDGGLFFNAIISFFAMIYFIVTDKGGLYFPPLLWVLGSISALLYAIGFYSMYLALSYGSFVMTKMITSFSLLFPLFFGLFFLKEPTTVFTYIGIGLIILSLVVKNVQFGKKPDAEPQKASSKWLVCTILSTVANGLISVISRLQQEYFHADCTNEFLLISLGGSFIALLVASLLKERGNIKYILKHGTIAGVLAGICNGAKNYIHLIVYLIMPISVSTPLGVGIGFITSFIFTKFIYKEKFTKGQLLGMILGGIAVIILKL